MISGADLRHLERLPPKSREKVMLLDGLGEDAMQASRGAQARLNEISRRAGPAGDPNISRLSAISQRESERHQTLFGLVTQCLGWLRTLPSVATLEPVEIEPPKLTQGERFEQAVGRVRNDIGLLTGELHRISHAPQPKAEIRKQVRPFVADLVQRAAPRLRMERGKPFDAIWSDHARDISISEGFVAGVVAWADPERFAKRLEGLIDRMPDDGALSDTDQAEKLASLKAEIEAKGRVEEALIEAAYSAGTEILRRANADPQCILCVQLVEPQRAAMQTVLLIEPGETEAEIAAAEKLCAERGFKLRPRSASEAAPKPAAQTELRIEPLEEEAAAPDKAAE
jgi:hypothetical protein